ncbi:MAG: beta-lactamase family protein [Symbiobacteriaceae bacterium]|nr:beta-lactamase family protein [Symbiobacteriaceae bacterium]
MAMLSASVKEKAAGIAAATIKQLKATSVQYAVRYRGEVVLSESVGKFDWEESKPLDSQDTYGVGSVSKVFVTAAAMLLMDQGLLDIDQPYKQYVTEFTMADPRYEGITIRHLMNHSSGIYGTHFKGGILMDDVNTYSHDNLLKNLQVATLKYDPGTFSEYCNDGFTMLEILVERISGISYIEFLNIHFFEPLGIKNTRGPANEPDRSHRARHVMPNLFQGNLPYESTNILGTGGILSTAEDLCLFAEVLSGKKILSAKAAAMMANPEYQNCAFWPLDEEQDGSTAYGLGYDLVHVHPFNKVGFTALNKGGDTMQYHASLVLIPELDIAAASVSAGASSMTNAILVVELLKCALLEYGIVSAFPEEPEYKAPVKETVPPETYTHAGLYANSGRYVTLAIEEDAISLPEMRGMVPAQQYVYDGKGKFVSPDGKITARFVATEAGYTFLQGDLVIGYPDIGQRHAHSFLFQKMVPNPLAPEVADAWAKRQGKRYIVLNDLVSSGQFANLSLANTLEMTVDIEQGYAAGGNKIVDANFAKNVLVFRDVGDLQFVVEGGKELLYTKDLRLMRVDEIPTFATSLEEVVVESEGYAVYYLIDKESEGYTINVEIPEGGLFAAYAKREEPKKDEDKQDKEQEKKPEPPPEDAPPPPSHLKCHSRITGNQSVILAEGDLLLFKGNPGDSFKITCIK